MKNTCAEKGDPHHMFQSLRNVFVGGLAQLCCDAGGRVNTGVPPQVGIMSQRSLAPASVLQCRGHPRAAPGWIMSSGLRAQAAGRKSIG